MTVLVVDDDPLSREAISDFVNEQLGHEVMTTGSPDEALSIVNERSVDLVVADIRLENSSGIELVRKIREQRPGALPEIVLVTGYADVNTSIQALRLGVADYLQKPVNVDELSLAVNKVERKRLARTAPRTADVVDMTEPVPLIYRSYSMHQAWLQAETLAVQRSVPVLIEGETGTGKEVIARVVHGGSGAFVALNCAAVPSALFESELFGYEDGAFTGARRGGAPGRFELADGGSLLLDEINELPPEMQAKLLRVLQERSLRRVGGGRLRPLNVRIICVSNQNLEALVAAGAFRADLFYRIAVGRIAVPALRERPEDIMPLAEYFLRKSSAQLGRRVLQITDDARNRLLHYHWPGNVRELRNAIERAVLAADDEVLRASHLCHVFGASVEGSSSHLRPGCIELPEEPFDLRELQREIVEKALRRFNGNKTQTAAYLGMSRSALRSRLEGK